MEGKEKRRKGWEVFEDELTPSAAAAPPGGSPSLQKGAQGHWESFILRCPKRALSHLIP